MNELTPQNPSSIRDMFTSISKHYDLTNSVLSAGIHRIWKAKLVRESGVKPGSRVLDCASGTGDLAFLFEKSMRGTGEVTGTDFCESMLDVARVKAAKIHSKAKFELADVTRLQYSDRSFDIASISFGIRNVQNPQVALSELGRVVNSGGRVLVLEFGQPQSKLMSSLFNFYSKKVLPKIGGWLSGQPKAYKYLQTSSAAFPCGDDFIRIALATGKFSQAKYIPLQSGIAYLYVLQVA